MKTILLLLFTFTTLNISSQTPSPPPPASPTSELGFQGRIVKENINATPSVSFIEQIDMDADGDLDLLSIDGYDIKWFENINANDTMLISHHVSDLGGNYITTGDIDNDGDIDIIAQNGTTVFYIQNLSENNNFADPIVLFSTNNSLNSLYSIAVDDLDSDGDLDIMYSYKVDRWYSSLKWLENTDGQGSFTIKDIDTYSYSQAIISADIDGDNDIDILSFNYKDQGIEWFVNDGEQNFTRQNITSAKSNGYATLHAKDIDGDNDLDLIVSDSEGYSTSFEEIKLLKNDGLGNFTEYQSAITTTLDFSHLNINDIDNDGDIDIAFTSDKDHTVGWFQNIDGQGTLGNYKLLNTKAQNAKCVISYDFDTDGDIDIISASQTDDKIAWYENIDDLGDFSSEQIITSNINNPNKVLAVDVDGDSDLDVIGSCSFGNKLAWYENLDGNGTFGPQKIIGSNIKSIQAFAAKDFDNDGDIDVVTGDSNSTSSPFMWFKNLDGKGNFSEPISLGGTSGLQFIDAADLDSDGDNDIIYNIKWVENKLSWRENTDSNGSFNNIRSITTTIGNNGRIELKDFNNDGHIDIAIQSQGNLAWYVNDGAGNFTENIIDSSFYRGLSFSGVDIDHDGDFDIVSAHKSAYYGDNKIGWYENTDGLGNFGSLQIIDNDIPNSQFGGFSVRIQTEDLNYDGHIDIIATTYDKIAWYENTDGTGVFTPQKKIIEGDFGIGSTHLDDINADGKPDIVTAYIIGGYANDFMNDKILWYKNLGLNSNKIRGVLKLDALSDGCVSSNRTLSNVMVVANSSSETLAAFTLSNGYYQLFPNLGTYTTLVASSLDNYYSSNPSSYNHSFTDIGNTEVANFCVEPVTSIGDVSISIFPTTEARPGFNASYQIVYKNVGTIPSSGNIVYQFDGSKLSLLSSSQSISVQNTNSLTFNYNNLLPLETKTFNLEFNLLPPPTVNIDDVLTHVVSMNPSSGESYAFAFNQTVIGSYDPNDIQVLEGEEVPLEDIDKYLHYIIRFQNTGTASAINVQIENVLNDQLDWTTMQLESLSHNGHVEISNGSVVSFVFDNIYLPDSTTDEPNSHGFIAYKIKPKNNVDVGDILPNKADIYFDFNPAIRTNLVTTEITNALGTDEKFVSKFHLYPNPTTGILNINSKSQIVKLEVYNNIGKIVLSDFNKTSIDVSALSTGLYFIKIEDVNGALESKKFIKE